MSGAGALGAALVAGFLRVPPLWGVSVALALLVRLLICINPPRAARVEHVLLARWTPFAIGVASSLVMLYAWGSLQQMPLRQDERAYVLQAELFAAGRWTDPPPPILQFFEQPHVLVTPALASEYPPGNSLILTPGVWLHAPGLIPVLLLGLSGGLVFGLTRTVVRGGLGPWVAVLAWIGWIGLTGSKEWPRPSYVSGITTSALWLVGWWALLRWREQRGLAWLGLLAVGIGWGAITRPLTMLAYAIPIGTVVIIMVARRHLWRQLGYATAVGALVLAVIPLWSTRTTGSWHETPFALYAAQHAPRDFSRPLSKDAPLRHVLPQDMACREQLIGEPQRRDLLLDAPADVVTQWNALVRDALTGWRKGLVPFVLIGLVLMPVELACAATCCMALLAVYVNYAHDPRLAVYSMEAQAAVVVLGAFGVCAVIALIGRKCLPALRAESRNDAASRLVGWCVIALVLMAAPPTLASLRASRETQQVAELPLERFRALLDGLPAGRAIVFVRDAPDSACGEALVRNPLPLATARAWVVYDRGAEDDGLLRLAPDRAPFLFDAVSGQLLPYGDGGPARRSHPDGHSAPAPDAARAGAPPDLPGAAS